MGSLEALTVFFIILLALFHSLLLFKSVRESGVFWHIVDYLWLLTAAVALAFATIEVQKLRVSSSLNERRATARGELNGVRMHASHIWEFQQGTLDKDGGHKGIDWFKKVSDELELGIDSFRWEHFVSQNYDELIRDKEHPDDRTSYLNNPAWEEYKLDLSTTNPYLVEDATNIIRDLKKISDEKFEITKAESDLKPNETEKSIKFTWLWFLCSALALRITKVTADLLRYKESSRKARASINKLESADQKELAIDSDAP